VATLALAMAGAGTAAASPAGPETPAAAPASPCGVWPYAEQGIWAGASTVGTVMKVHSALGLVVRTACSLDRREGIDVRIGGYLDLGEQTLGGDVNGGAEVEINSGEWAGYTFEPFRLGIRVAAGKGKPGHETVAAGIRARSRYVAFGLDLVYATPGRELTFSQPAAFGVVGMISLNGKPAAILLAVEVVLGLLALTQFKTT